ncbi:Nn.00g054770.m01.CDS01 [Neocucurbitaria sp. VM-36]
MAARAAEIAESADEGSPRPDSPVQRTTEGFCRNCCNKIGEFYNSWHRVTGSYFVPALLGSYRSLLEITGREKAASKGTNLEGCTIQPLSCPAPGCTDSPIGFTVVDAPAGKRNFRGRDFFKLNRIELRCKVSPNTSIVVEPHEDTAPGLLAVEDSASPTPDRATTPTSPSPPAEVMEIDSRPPASQHPGHHHNPHEQHHDPSLQHQPLHQVEADKHSLPPPSLIRSPLGLASLQTDPQKAPGNPLLSPSPAVRPIHDVQHAAQVHSRGATVKLTSCTREPLSTASQPPSPHELHHANGHQYPCSPREVAIDAIERLQTQISQNSGALAAHTRDIRRGEESFQRLEDSLRRDLQGQLIRQSGDIRRVDEAVARLHHEMQGITQVMEGLSRELHATRVDRQSRGSTMPPGQTTNVQDSALELMAQQISIISQKANEVDTLKITIEIMKNKIQRLEEAASLAPSQPTLQAYQATRESTALVAQSTHTTASYHPTPVAISHITPGQPSKSQTYYSFATPSATTPETSQRPEPVPTQSSGWATVNAGVKRTHSNGMESPHETSKHMPGSPKRPRLATVEPSITHETSLSQTDTDGSETRTHAYALAQPSQYSLPESVLAAQSQQTVYIPYGTQDGPSEDNWRSESHRTIEHRPRGRGRGGGPGSRGGRGRKSMPAQIHTLRTPEWDNDDWQSNPDGSYNHVARLGRGIARRGSGGGGTRGGYTASDRAVSLGLQGVTAGMGIEPPIDLYSHTKKTRTKPIRNADGVLIRKDGRPDMRSQSSAANLRKVHARKDGDPNHSPSTFTPTNLHYSDSAGAPDTPSPSGYGLDHGPDHSVSASIHKKHSAIMNKMFPSGVDESRKQYDYTRQVFEEDRDHTVHPRTQNHHQSTKSSLQIKREHFEQDRVTDLQSPRRAEDVDTDDAEDQADDEGQAPGEQSDKSPRAYLGAHWQETLAQDRLSNTGSQAVPETQAVDNQTLGIDSTQIS